MFLCWVRRDGLALRRRRRSFYSNTRTVVRHSVTWREYVITGIANVQYCHLTAKKLPLNNRPFVVHTRENLPTDAVPCVIHILSYDSRTIDLKTLSNNKNVWKRDRNVGLTDAKTWLILIIKSTALGWAELPKCVDTRHLRHGSYCSATELYITYLSFCLYVCICLSVCSVLYGQLPEIYLMHSLIGLCRLSTLLHNKRKRHFNLLTWRLLYESQKTIRTRDRASTSSRWHFAFGLCCHSNETRAPIANAPNSAQLEGTPYHSPSYMRIGAVVRACGEGQTDTQTNIHFASSTTHAKCDYDNTFNRMNEYSWCKESEKTCAPCASITQI